MARPEPQGSLEEKARRPQGKEAGDPEEGSPGPGRGGRALKTGAGKLPLRV